MERITKDTLVPIGIAAASVTVLAGGIFWLSTLWADVQNLKTNQGKLEAQIYQTNDTVSRISEKLIRLESKTDSILEKLDDLKKNLTAKTVSL